MRESAASTMVPTLSRKVFDPWLMTSFSCSCSRLWTGPVRGRIRYPLVLQPAMKSDDGVRRVPTDPTVERAPLRPEGLRR